MKRQLRTVAFAPSMCRPAPSVAAASWIVNPSTIAPAAVAPAMSTPRPAFASMKVAVGPNCERKRMGFPLKSTRS
jgi:hypothetical protein